MRVLMIQLTFLLYSFTTLSSQAPFFTTWYLDNPITTYESQEANSLVSGNCTEPILLTTYVTNSNCSIAENLMKISGNLDQAFDDDCNAYCGLTGNPTLWYELPIDTNAAILQVSVDGLGFNATWGIYDSCDGDIIQGGSLNYPILCGEESINGGIHSVGVDSELTPSIYIAISATDNILDGSFTMSYSTSIICEPCIGESEFDCDNGEYILTIDEDEDGIFETVIPNDGTGSITQNTNVEICFEYTYDTSGTGADWIHGLVPTFGNGWDLSATDFSSVSIPEFDWYEESDTICYPRVTETMPNLCTYLANEGKLKLCNVKCQDCPCENGPALEVNSPIPSGWFANTFACGGSNCPYEEYGLSGGTQYTFSFCIKAKTKTFDTIEEFQENNNLSISFQTFSDGVTGCWEDPVSECIVDPAALSPYYNLLFYTQIDEAVFDISSSCIGADGVATILNSGDYDLIQWDTIGSTGNTYTIPDLQIDTTFIITLTDRNGMMTFENVTMVVDSNPEPVITGSLSFCPGSNTVLGLTDTYTAYDWSTSDMESTTTINNIGTVSVTVTDTNGCTGSSSVVIIENSNLSIAGDSISVCDDGVSTATFDAGDSNPNYSFDWDDNSLVNGTVANGTLTTSISGSYSVTVTDLLTNCTGTGVYTLTLDTQPIIALTPADDICNDNANGNTIINLTDYEGSSDPGTWSDDDAVFGVAFEQNNLDFNGLPIGEYTFTFTTAANGECPALSQSLSIAAVDCGPIFDCPDLMANYGDSCDDGDIMTENDVIQADCTCGGEMITATHNLAGSSIDIYPNPVSDVIKIDVSSELQYSLTLFRLDGQIVYQTVNAKSIPVSNLSKGIYILKINELDGTSYIIEKIVVE